MKKSNKKASIKQSSDNELPSTIIDPLLYNELLKSCCILFNFKCWLFLIQKVIGVDFLLKQTECPWEGRASIRKGKPVWDLVTNHELWPSFINDENFLEFMFILKYLWYIHCKNEHFEIVRVSSRKHSIKFKKECSLKEISGFWMAFQHIDNQANLTVLAYLNYPKMFQNQLEIKSSLGKLGWGPLFFADNSDDQNLYYSEYIYFHKYFKLYFVQ